MKYALVIETSGADLRRVREGTARLAALADAASIPITWALEARRARALAEFLNERNEAREEQRDDIVLVLPTQDWLAVEDEPTDDTARLAERLVREREELPGRIDRERDRLQQAIPWARPKVAGAELKSPALVEALEILGFEGLWGYRWNEASRRAQDRGCPFGFFYAGRERHQSAGPPISTVVGVPREMGDLSFWRRIPPEPSEPSPLASEAPMPSATIDLEAMEAALDAYAASGPLNEWTAIVQTLPAEAFAEAEDETIGRLEAFWTRVRERGFEPTSLAESVAEYRSRFPETEPTFLVWTTPDEEDGKAIREFYYYDARMQLVFDDDASEPAEFFNYVSPSLSSRFLTEYETPVVTAFTPIRHRERLTLEFVIDAPKPMPYALFLWNDHRHLQPVESNVLELRWVGEHGLLLLLDLETGENTFAVVLTI